MEQTDPFICMAESPWVPSIRGLVLHPDAVVVDGARRCPHCGYIWGEEFPRWEQDIDDIHE
jgi:hypothetical protein